MEQLPTPHNNFFQFALSQLPNARSLIETQLSGAALAELDLQTLQLEAGSFVDADLREKFSDLLMSVRLSESDVEQENNQALVYFLFEHKSQSDPLTVVQLLSYIVRIGEKRLRDGLPLCPLCLWWSIMAKIRGERHAIYKNSSQRLRDLPNIRFIFNFPCWT